MTYIEKLAEYFSKSIESEDIGIVSKCEFHPELPYMLPEVFFEHMEKYHPGWPENP